MLPVRVQQAGEAADKCGPDTLRVEGRRADQRHEAKASVVCETVAAVALEQAIALGSIIADGADG